MAIRITETGKSYLSLWIGVAVAVGFGGAIFWYYNQEAPQMDPSGKVYLKLVPPDEKLRKRLSDVAYHVIRENGTETAFQNKYFNNFQPGLYVDVVTGEPLFSSADKFEGNTGRPTFSKPIGPDLIAEQEDTSHDMKRTEVHVIRSRNHLGHVFGDGPPPSGKRYAVNSAALRFVPQDVMEKEGYGEFMPAVTGAAPAPPAAK